MTDNNIKTLLSQTGELLKSGRYKDTFTLLRRRLNEHPVAGCLGRLNQTENTYKYLLQYFAQGASDPGRQEMLGDIRRELLEIAGLIEKEVNAEDSSEQFYSTLRMRRMRPVDLNSALASILECKSMADLTITAGSYPMDVMAKLEDAENKIFETFWVADSLDAETYRKFSRSISDGSMPKSTASLFLSGVGLGLMNSYNHEGMMLLCDVAAMPDSKLSARATVNLVLALDKWNSRVNDDKKLMQGLEALADMDGMPKKIRKVVFALIKTKDTDRVTQKMRKEVIPGLMQFGPDVIKKMKQASEEASFHDIEGNPEWEELLKKSGLEDKLRELTEMQSDGADVMMAAFSNLKGFPFFRQLSNWMRPFSIHHTMLNSLSAISDDGISSLLEINGMMCDSDKYSFAFSLATMPELQRKMVMGQMQGQMEQLREQMKEIEALKAGHEFEDEVTRYCRDLYRFYKLYPKHSEFYDPFSSFPDFAELPVFGRFFDAGEEMAAVAEFYFKRGYYADALPILRRIADSAADSPHVWEKIGFSIEKTSDSVEKAIEAYMKAQLFNPESKWIARRLGLCYRRAGDYRNAVEYLRMSLPEDDSFDKRVLLMIVDALMDDSKYGDALKELYRVDYETPGDAEVIRRMARCAFMASDLDKAKAWLDSIPGIAKSEEDYRMSGHISFLRHDIQDAMRWYRMTVRQNDNRRLWKTSILSDMDTLESMGASRSDMLLLLESLSYSLES
ncbi:MAG: tetratricopeptide repeat protein [Muribaculum sp.]|nr:tetratricopeptide repeat protein [Muribaculum sp.]